MPHKETEAIRAARKRREHPDREAASQHKYYIDNREERLRKNEERRFLWRYGISKAKKIELFQQQGNKCASCRVAALEYTGHWHTDADHTVDPPIVRGILCRRCNVAVENCKSADLVWALSVVRYIGGFNG